MNYSSCEVEKLPGSAVIFRMVHHSDPVLLVHGHLDVVAVGPLVPVPQQHVDPVDDARHP